MQFPGTREKLQGCFFWGFGGDFPLWIAPNQVVILPVSEKNNDYSKKIYKKIRENKVRCVLDLRDEKVGAKIRKAELSKIPIMLVIGEKEESTNSVSVRRRKKGDIGKFDLDDFISNLVNEITNKELGY